MDYQRVKTIATFMKNPDTSSADRESMKQELRALICADVAFVVMTVYDTLPEIEDQIEAILDAYHGPDELVRNEPTGARRSRPSKPKPIHDESFLGEPAKGGS